MDRTLTEMWQLGQRVIRFSKTFAVAQSPLKAFRGM